MNAARKDAEAIRNIRVAPPMTEREMHGANLYTHWCGGPRANRVAWSALADVERERWCALAEELQSLGVG